MTYLCHVDGNEMPDCSIDNNEPENCFVAQRLMKQGKKKEDCEYWKKSAPNEKSVTSLALQLACQRLAKIGNNGLMAEATHLIHAYMEQARKELS